MSARAPLALAAALAFATACQEQGGAPASAAPSKGSTSSAASVATVNGQAITEAELVAVLKPSAHQPDAPPADRRKAALAALVRDELMRQQALEAGLVPDGPAAEELKRLEAQLAVARRKALADAWLRRELEKAEPSEAEAKAVFEQQREAYATDYHVQQLFLRDEAAIAKAAAALDAGQPFEAVARAQFAGLPETFGSPWELGFLAYKQLPEPWRPVLATLQPGQTSGVIKGPNGRFWLIHLVEKRPRPDASFDELKPLILDDLRRARLEQVTQTAEAELRKGARITEP